MFRHPRNRESGKTASDASPRPVLKDRTLQLLCEHMEAVSFAVPAALMLPWLHGRLAFRSLSGLLVFPNGSDQGASSQSVPPIKLDQLLRIPEALLWQGLECCRDMVAQHARQRSVPMGQGLKQWNLDQYCSLRNATSRHVFPDI